MALAPFLLFVPLPPFPQRLFWSTIRALFFVSCCGQKHCPVDAINGMTVAAVVAAATDAAFDLFLPRAFPLWSASLPKYTLM